MHVRVGLYRKLSAKELILLNCGIGEVLRVPWSARKSNQYILKEISSEYAEAETPIVWSPDAKNWLIGKDPDAGKE